MSLDIPIYLSGARNYDYLIGTSKANKGTIIQVKGYYPPNKNEINQNNIYPIYNKLTLLPYFGDKNYEQILYELYNNSTPNNDLYLHECNIEIKFIKIGGYGFLKKLSQDQINYLLSSNENDGFRPIKDVYNMIPPNKPNSRATRHTLIFRPSIWSIMLKCKQVNYANGLCINSDDGNIISNITASPGYTIYDINMSSELSNILKVESIYIYARKNNYLTLDMLKVLINKLIKNSDDEWNTLYNLISWFSPSIHKSLIQKIIRTGCSNLYHGDKIIRADLALLMSFSILITCSGSFVPDLSRYVSGGESATKRLAVSIYEDSYTEYPSYLLSMLASSLLIQNDNTWKPHIDVIEKWMIVALQSLKDKRMYEYDFELNTNITQWNPISCSYLLLTQIKSFKSDIKMMSSIAKHDGMHRSYITKSFIESIPLIHCIDQHSLSDIAYYIETDVEYTQLFDRIFGEVTGCNPRKYKYINYYENLEQYGFVKIVRQAQYKLWINKTSKGKNIIQNNGNKKVIEYKLDESWIAGLLGPIEIKLGNMTIIVTLKPDDIYRFIAIKKPSRGDKDVPELSEYERYYAISYVKEMLVNTGINLKDVPSSLSWLQGSKLKIIDDKYYIYFNNLDTPFLYTEILNTINAVYEYDMPNIDDEILYAITNTGDCMCTNIYEEIDKICKEYDVVVLKRLLNFMTGYKSIIEMYKISKKGEGNEYQVFKDDSKVFLIMCKLCNRYPAALELIGLSKFKVKYGPLLWKIRDRIYEYCSSMEATVADVNNWYIGGDSANRQLWEHQKDTIEMMKEKHELGKKGHLIWIPVRFGKTLIFMHYLYYRIVIKRDMPMYCVYTLPISALESIMKEIIFFNVPYQLIDMATSRNGNKELKPYCINIIYHDHLRMNGMDNMVKMCAGKMLFVVDEFHKMLNQTKRTSIALEVARLSNDYIGLSGTVIKDNNIKNLNQWLEQNVEFEVTENNFWVAIGSMISKKLHTKVTVERYNIEAEFEKEEKEEYIKYVPPSIGGLNINNNAADFRNAANLCWNVSNRKIVELAIGYIQHGERIMIVAKDINNQGILKNMLMNKGLHESYIFVINKENKIDYPYTDTRNYYVVITTPSYSEGYSLSKLGVMITGVYFGNQATREQLEGRINEPNQGRTKIIIVIVHCGLLTYVLDKYENVRSLSAAVKEIGEKINQ